MDSPGEILSLCRLCLVKDQVNIPIFEEQGDIRQIFLKISSCLPVTITRHDQLPKKICDGCSNKLDLLYEFWNSSASAEKTLLSWLGQAGVADAGEKISAVAQQIAKPAETLVKEESETLDESHLINESNVINEANLTNESRDSFEENSLDEDTKDEAEAPPPKRARRTAAVKAQINITPESDEDDDEDYDAGEAMTKMEDESDESESELKDDPSYSEVAGTSADDQAGPSGVGKDGVEAPCQVDTASPETGVEIKEKITVEEQDMKLEGDINESEQSLKLKRENKLKIPTNLQIKANHKNYMDCFRKFLHDQHVNNPLVGGVTSRPVPPPPADRPLKCDICNVQFKRKCSLNAHRNKHRWEKWNHCKICNKTFLTLQNLKNHYKIHSGNQQS